MTDPFAETLGIWFEDDSLEGTTARLCLTDRHVNQHGTAHGGVLFSLADALFAKMSNASGVPAVAVDTSMTFISAGRPGDLLVATCREESVRRTLAVYTVRIRSANRLLALFRGTVARLGEPTVPSCDFGNTERPPR